MNFLAHALLAGGDADLEVGGILGDFVHGQPDPALPEGLRRGIVLHRAVDSFTDHHARVLAAHALFDPPWRRYAGILLDVWFDHCLACDFGRWSDLPLNRFSARLRQHLDERSAWLPPRLRRFAAYMQVHDLPAAYADAAMIGEVLAGLGQRLSRTNPLARALPVLQARDAVLRQCFADFFPDLVDFAQGWRER
ncbi:MAG TPA: ACP phosphodiesterase [Rhodanobacteraceae bacterium]